MSDNILRLIPTDPLYVPGMIAQRQARDMLTSFLPQSNWVRVTVTEKVKFVDPGTNLRSILCPNCGANLNMAWWQQEMSKAYQTEFTHLDVEVPCCGTTISLNNLQYDWTSGFARFVLEASNPNADLDEKQLDSIAQILVCNLKKVWAHY